MLRKLRERAQDEKGFTLIELLVVILIIGILAAIAIPSFLNQRQKGTDAEAKTQVTTASQAMETCATDNDGSYATCDLPTIRNIEPSLNDAGARLTQPSAPTATTYVVRVSTSDSRGQSYTITKNTNGTTARSCATASSGGCRSNSTW
jgi:type IV pilus assembly protein PilA